eukprot:scaffold6186_cov134-Pinguiococcus_pyrenoidosus.AAC.1
MPSSCRTPSGSFKRASRRSEMRFARESCVRGLASSDFCSTDGSRELMDSSRSGGGPPERPRRLVAGHGFLRSYALCLGR